MPNAPGSPIDPDNSTSSRTNGRGWPSFLGRRHPRLALALLLASALIVGCAEQYHWYRCGCDCVNYQYCPPRPLPYSPYCSCPTPISHSYHQRLQEGQTASTEAGPLDPPATQDSDNLPLASAAK